MATLPELTRLFAKLASDLRRSDAAAANHPANDDDDETATAISRLAGSLNIDDLINPRVRVLDSALSLMCFDSSEALRARIECSVRTIISVLSSTVSCKVLKVGGGDSEFLKVGSSISYNDCGELIRICADVPKNLEGDNGLIHSVFYAVLKAAVLLSGYQTCFPDPQSVFNEARERKNDDRTAMSKLICFLPDDNTLGTHENPMRLLLWYLDPLILKLDISEILLETIKRPFLSLKRELHDRVAWHSIILCLVTSPTMFLETRALLHRWFLLTGLAELLDLQVAITYSVLDVLSRPMWWRVSMEVGLKYPFLHAYFPIKHRELLAILTGPISCESFMDLVHCIRMEITRTLKYTEPILATPSNDISRHGAIISIVDDNSTWAMLMNFPAWFYFAITLVFSGKDSQDSIMSKTIFSYVETEVANDIELHKAVTLYISWVLCPFDESHRILLERCIQDAARSWITRCRETFSYEQPLFSETHDRNTQSHSKKLRIPKVGGCDKLHVTAENKRGWAVGAWIKEFDGLCVKTCRMNTSHIQDRAKGKESAAMQPNRLLIKVPLGILICCPGNLDEKGCELLLHYASTGEILQSGEMQKETQGYLGQDLAFKSEDERRKQALEGAQLVFNLFEIIEDMSVMLYDSEDTRVNFICQIKGRASTYLLRCVKMLLEFQLEQFQVDDVGKRVTMLDLFRRLTEWMQQGREVFTGCREFDDVVGVFSRKFSILQQN